MKKLLTIALMIIMLFLTNTFINAETTSPTFSVPNLTAKAGDTIEVPIQITNNPGIIGLRLFVSFDSDKLELLNAEAKDFEDVSFAPLTNNPFIVSWIDSIHGNNTTNGTLAVLTFMVKENCTEGDTAINLSYEEDDVFNIDYYNVKFIVQAGTISITYSEEPEILFGDVNCNGIINMRDVAMLQKIIANIVTFEEIGPNSKINSDVDHDQKESLEDVVLIQKYIIGIIDEF